jgi:hypothetical protein
MKTLPNSQATFLDETEFPLMSSQADSRAKTLAALESKQASAKAQGPASGPKSSDLLASYHPASSSWRTSQHCLVAQVNSEGDGLAQFSETWPSAGMMRNGKAFSPKTLVCKYPDLEFGYVPTPRKSMWRKWWSRLDYHQNIEEWGPTIYPELDGQWINVEWVEEAMGFPTKHTDLKD